MAELEDKIRLSNLIESYGGYKKELDMYTKLCNETNSRIKDIMRELHTTGAESDTYKVTYSKVEKSSVNEDGLLSYLQKSNIPTGIIKTKEYIDFDELENAIYNGEINTDIVKGIKAYTKTTTYYQLRIQERR